MTEEKQAQRQERETASERSRAWQEVGRQFKAFGESLSAALQESSQEEAMREYLRALEGGLRSLAEEVARAVDETAASPEGQRLREEFEQAARSAREATRKAWQEARPQMLSALETLDGELHRVMDDLRHATETGEEPRDVGQA
ncbi:MAG: hypothetical protein ACP5HM_12835 [Anaerolineae bacterium]